MYLPIEMKEEILNGTMAAFISNEIEIQASKRCYLTETKKGISLNNVYGDEEAKEIAYIECLGVIKFDSFCHFYDHIKFVVEERNSIGLSCYSLGIEEFDFYLEEKFNFKKAGYLHFFKLIETIENKE